SRNRPSSLPSRWATVHRRRSAPRSGPLPAPPSPARESQQEKSRHAEGGPGRPLQYGEDRRPQFRQDVSFDGRLGEQQAFAVDLGPDLARGDDRPVAGDEPGHRLPPRDDERGEDE